jgi:hypothetical protein
VGVPLGGIVAVKGEEVANWVAAAGENIATCVAAEGWGLHPANNAIPKIKLIKFPCF